MNLIQIVQCLLKVKNSVLDIEYMLLQQVQNNILKDILKDLLFQVLIIYNLQDKEDNHLLNKKNHYNNLQIILFEWLMLVVNNFRIHIECIIKEF